VLLQAHVLLCASLSLLQLWLLWGLWFLWGLPALLLPVQLLQTLLLCPSVLPVRLL
jgi:hypothetical protein